MATQLVIHADGTAEAVYSDRFRCVLEALGDLQVTRASEVEFEPQTGEWVARHAMTGQEIGRDRNRSEAIRQEVVWLEQNLTQKKGE